MSRRKLLPSIGLGLLIVFTCALFAPARQAAAPAGGGADAQKVRKLLELSGSGDIGKQMMDQMFTSFRRAMPNVPVEFWEEASRDVTANDFVTMLVPVYQKHFSTAEVDQLIAFYQSPIGQKLVHEQPGILQDSVAAGRVFGQQVAAKVQQKLKDKGLDGK